MGWEETKPGQQSPSLLLCSLYKIKNCYFLVNVRILLRKTAFISMIEQEP